MIRMTDNFPQYDPSRPIIDQVTEPAPDPWSGEEIKVKTPAVYKGPKFELGDQTFKARRSINKWVLLMVAAAEKRKDEDAQAVAFYEMAMASVHPDDLARFNDYMLQHGDDDDAITELRDALGGLVDQWTGRKSEPSPTSSPASPTEETPPLSRHVSFSEGKVTVLPVSTQEISTAGPESLAG